MIGIVASWALVGCRGGNLDDGELRVRAPAGDRAVIDAFVGFVGDPRLSVDDGSAPADIALELDLTAPKDSYQLETRADHVVVHATDITGLQYGLAAVLEAEGYRFHHPHRTALPDVLVPTPDLGLGGDVVSPQMTTRRGLHLHTLHPLESYYDFWEPGDGQLERAQRVIDWVVKSGGDYVQYPGLDDIQFGGDHAARWAEHTKAIVDFAHARGVEVGIGVQLFGSGNLQNAFDLVDGDTLDEETVRERLRILAPAGYDVLSLSFGEFSGEEPETFVSVGNRAVALAKEELGVSEVVTTIHVGNYDDLRIEYQGEEMLYYFLADYLEDTTPWIHTVMYYNLYEDAGGAYLHDEFDEHRAFLEEHLDEGRRVGYHPESAYWVAFDISIPVYLPVYLKSRFVDFDRLRGRLQDHVTFSSGWEWGYWQTDRAVLAWTHTLPETWESFVAREWAPYGADGRVASDTIVALAEVQHAALLVDRLAPYYASRDSVIDFGDRSLGILSQPDRPTFTEIGTTLGPAELDGVAAKVERMRTFAADTRALLAPLEGVREGDPFFDELRDGVEIDAIRAEFAVAVNDAAVRIARGGDAAAPLAEADALLAQAQEVVDRRAAGLHWTGGDRILQPSDQNAGLYNYGYLGRAHELCYWRRERIEVGRLLGDPTTLPPCT